MSEVFQRLEDRETLTLDDRTVMLAAEGIFNIARDREFAGGQFGEASPLSSVIAQNTFTLSFVSADTTGFATLDIRNFFARSDGFYTIEDIEHGLPTTEFSVIAVDIDAYATTPTVSVTCQSRYGDFLDEDVFVIAERTQRASSDIARLQTNNWTNPTDQWLEVQLVMESNTLTNWRADIPYTIRRGTNSNYQTVIVAGQSDDFGNRQSYQSYRVVYNAWTEVEEGYGSVVPGATTFWRMQPGQRSSVELTATSAPATGNHDITIRLEAILKKQKRL